MTPQEIRALGIAVWKIEAECRKKGKERPEAVELIQLAHETITRIPEYLRVAQSQLDMEADINSLEGL